MLTAFSSVLEGLDLRSLRPGSLIDVETESRSYRIECLGGDAIRISGHPLYCPQPVAAQLRGSLDEEGVLDAGLIEPGMRLMFFVNHHPMITSRVVRVHADQPNVLPIAS